MRRWRRLIIPAAATTVVATSLLSGALASAHGATHATSSSGGGTVVTLPSGDRVTVSAGPAGQQAVSLLPDSSNQTFQAFQLGGHLYAVPESVIQTQGRDIDLASYDVTHLVAAAQGSSVAAAEPHVVQPGFQMYTLTVNAIDAQGTLDNGDDAFLVNVDDTRRYANVGFFENGQFKASVPAGHYALMTFFFDPTTNSIRLVVNPTFTVSGPGDVTVDARSATVPVSVTFPKATNPLEQILTVDRDAKSFGSASSAFISGGANWFVAPTQPVSIGDLHYYSYFRAASPAGVSPAYHYDVEFPSDHAIPANQTFTVFDSDLGAQDTSYYADGQPRTALGTWFSFLPWETFNFRLDNTFPRPLQQTEFYTARPDLVYQRFWFADFDNFADMFESSYQSYTAGTQPAVRWLGGPLHPNVMHDFNAPFTFACPACRGRDTLGLEIFAFGNNRGDFGFLDTTDTSSFTIFENGNQIASGNGSLIGTFPLASRTSKLQIDYDVARTEPWWTQSTASHTEWVVNSSGGKLPSGWVCLDGTTKCSTVPLLFATYNLPTDLFGQEAAGPTQYTLTVEHMQGSVSTPIDSVTADVSFDGGQTWTPADVMSTGGGEFTVSYTNPAASDTDGYAALRISAVDADGNAIHQTTQRAYAIAP